jgi:two-component system, OmpR family, catabolic regulation response regulator CreB
MEKRDHEQVMDLAESAAQKAVSRTVLEPADGELILYLCEDIRTAKREVVPILNAAGYEVRIAKANPLRSLNLLTQRCQLVLLDIGLPDAVGYRICAQIRSISHLPIMLILRGSGRSDVLRGFEVGADTFVLAPIPTREFVVRLQALLRRRPCRQLQPDFA